MCTFELGKNMLEDSWSVSENCLYVVFKPKLTQGQIYSYFESLISDVEVNICKRSSTYVPNCKHIINILPVSEGDKSPAYVWVTNKQVLNMITGYNYDGSVIVSAPVESHNEPKSAKDTLFTMDWDMRPVLSRPTEYHEKYSAKAVDGCTLTPFFAKARACDPGPEYTFGTLFCKSPLPKTYKESYLVELFAPFNTSETDSIYVTKTYKGNAYVKFPNKIDACFALMLTKKYYDVNRDLMLCFDHAQYHEERPKPTRSRNDYNSYNKRK